MTWYVQLAIGFALMTGLIFTGVPVFVAFLIINIAGILIAFGSSAFGLFTNSLLTTLTAEPLSAVPLFLLMGEFLFRSGAIDTLYDAIDKLIGRTRIRLYALAIGMATALGTLSGSAMADAAMMGRTLFPGMVARGYDRKMSAGLIMSGATIAPIIPPSILAVVLGTLAQVSIAELLVSGIGPGLFLALLFLLYVRIRVWLDPSKAPAVPDESAPRTLSGIAMAVLQLLPFGGVIFMVMGFILLGIATPTEAAACGVAATVGVAAYHRRLTWRLLAEATFRATVTTATIFVIIMTANLFGQLLSYTGAPEEMIRLVEHLDVNRWVIYFLLMLIGFVICMFLGQIEFMLISVPIYSPLVAALGFEPIWFWMIYLINITTGGMTPPFGVTMFVFKASVPDMSIVEVYNATWPYVALIMFGLVLMTLMPDIVLFVPELMR